VIAVRNLQALRVASARAPGRRSIAVYALVAAALEIAAATGETLAAVIGYALLVILVATQIGVALLRSSAEGARALAPAAMLAVPLSIRLVALTLQHGSVPVARHFALVGPTAVTALICAGIGFAKLRPRLDPLVRDRRQLQIALSGLPVGLLCALVFSRDSLAPQHGRWSSTVAVLVLVTAAAVTEELLFRGFLQSALGPLVGNLAPLVGIGAVALAYFGVHPVGFIWLAVLLGLCSSLLVERTGRFEGVVAARVLLYAGLFVFWPRLLGLH
jgi:membrane protease YdiL (CAAX protease family)